MPAKEQIEKRLSGCQAASKCSLFHISHGELINNSRLCWTEHRGCWDTEPSSCLQISACPQLRTHCPARTQHRLSLLLPPSQQDRGSGRRCAGGCKGQWAKEHLVLWSAHSHASNFSTAAMFYKKLLMDENCFGIICSVHPWRSFCIQ